jgi:hypothetical protein
MIMPNVTVNVTNERVETFSIDGDTGGSIRLVDVTIDEVVVTHVAAIDLITIVTGRDRHDSARILRRITSENDEFKTTFSHLFAGRGRQYKTALLNFREALALVMQLPGKTAKEFRRSACTILARYMVGDVSLIDEIEANTDSTSFTLQAARHDLGIDSTKRRAPSELIETRKRLKIESAVDDYNCCKREREALAEAVITEANIRIGIANEHLAAAKAETEASLASARVAIFREEASVDALKHEAAFRDAKARREEDREAASDAHEIIKRQLEIENMKKSNVTKQSSISVKPDNKPLSKAEADSIPSVSLWLANRTYPKLDGIITLEQILDNLALHWRKAAVPPSAKVLRCAINSRQWKPIGPDSWSGVEFGQDPDKVVIPKQLPKSRENQGYISDDSE